MMSTPENRESGPPLHVLLDLTEAAADMQRLLLLDAAWTSAAEGGHELGERDREALVSLGNKMDAQLATLERHAHTLRETCEGHRVWVNERVADTLTTSEHFTDAQREDVRRLLKVEDDDFAGRGVAIADELARRAPVEREELRRKIPALRENGPVVTDLDHGTGCGIMGASFMLGAFVCFETAGAGCAVAGLAMIGMVTSGC